MFLVNWVHLNNIALDVYIFLNTYIKLKKKNWLHWQKYISFNYFMVFKNSTETIQNKLDNAFHYKGMEYLNLFNDFHILIKKESQIFFFMYFKYKTLF